MSAGGNPSVPSDKTYRRRENTGAGPGPLCQLHKYLLLILLHMKPHLLQKHYGDFRFLQSVLESHI